MKRVIHYVSKVDVAGIVSSNDLEMYQTHQGKRSTRKPDVVVVSDGTARKVQIDGDLSENDAQNGGCPTVLYRLVSRLKALTLDCSQAVHGTHSRPLETWLLLVALALALVSPIIWSRKNDFQPFDKKFVY